MAELKHTPHEVTPAIAARGTELLAESAAAYDAAIAIGRAIESLEKQKDDAWELCKVKRIAAGRVLLGPDLGYRGYGC